MSSAISLWALLFAVLFYIFTADPNVPLFFSLYFRKLSIQAKAWLFMLSWNPNSPWGKYNIWRTATRNSKENARILMKELGIRED